MKLFNISFRHDKGLELSMRLFQVSGFVVLGALFGCATVFNGTTQRVSVSTTPENGAKCTLSNSQGAYYVTTPGITTVQKTKTDLLIHCEMEGYKATDTKVTANYQYIPDLPVAHVVDAASGANYSYVSPLIVPMTKSDGKTNVVTLPPDSITRKAPH